MPSVLLEHHLALLAHEVALVTEGSSRADVLALMSDRLQQERTAILSDEETAALEEDFDAATASEPDRVPRIGLLIASAVADEGRGLLNVQSSLLEWIADQDRFSPRWLSAVDACLASARLAAHTA